MPLGPPIGPLPPGEARAWAALEMLLDNATFGLGFLDRDLRYVRVNPALAGINGLPPAEHVGRTMAEILPHLAPTLEPVMRKVLETGEPVSDLEVLGETGAAPGRRRSFTASCYPVKPAGGPPEGVGWVVLETTARRAAEAALERAEGMFRSLVEESLVGIYIIQDGRFVYVNPKMAEIFGYPRSELVGGVEIGDLVAPEDRALVTENVRRRIAGELSSMHYTFRGLCRNGAVVDVEVLGTRTEFGGRPAVIGTGLDVTEQRRLEARFRQAQKMEAVGRLAGGVAHDFNNLLTVIGGYAELLLGRMEPGAELRHDVEEIRRASQRASSLTRQLLAFSRQQVLQPRVLDLNEVVVSMERMLRRLIGEDVELLSEPGPDLWPVKADPGQLEQVILNLVLNGRDAMPSGGRLTLATANVDLQAGRGGLRIEVPPGDYVMLSLSDTGVGMDEDVLSHLCEPFFTTKEQGQGTGLGTATVYGIVEQSAGTLEVTSRPGEGTTFRVFLPRAAGTGTQVAHAAPDPGARGREVLLLVEDESQVRQLAAHILEGRGHRVLQAADGEHALRALDAEPGEVHLLVTDVVMPGMGGLELAERVQAARPGIRVLFVSGYSDDAVVRLGALGPGRAYLQKPFSPATLSQRVREVLDATP